MESSAVDTCLDGRIIGSDSPWRMSLLFPRVSGWVFAVDGSVEYYVEESRRVPDCSRIHLGVFGGFPRETLRKRIGFGIG